jgi:hypothetical protein
MNVSVFIKDVEVDAGKVLNYLAKAEKATPEAAAGLAVVLGAVSKAVTDGSAAAAASGVNISLDSQTVSDLKAVWPDIKSFAATLGIKL